MAGVSIWWPTPARSDRHFTAEQLDASNRHHRPIRRCSVLAMVARVGLLGVAAAAAGAFDDADWLAPFDRRLGWFETVTAPRVLIGVALTVAALRIPSIAADGWFEFGFRRGVPGYRPVPLRSFIAVSVGLAMAIVVVLSVVVGLAYRFALGEPQWPLALAAAVGVITAGSMVGERWVRSRLPGGERPLAIEPELRRSLDRLAERFAVGQPTFTSSASPPWAQPTRPEPNDNQPSNADEEHRLVESPNAYAVGVGPFRRVALSDSLLDEDPETIRFVVAHEMAHLARRHLLIQTGLRLAIQLLTIAVVAMAVDRSQPWAWLELTALDPIGLPVLALVLLAVEGVVRPVESWASRVQERSADARAVAAVGPLDPEEAKRLYVPGLVDLDPPGWAQLLAVHPSPTQRLEFLARLRRTAPRPS
jgi:Zn-dependent protease with chaperone function